MNVIEQFSVSKTGQADDNEDFIVVTDSFGAVIDGMTPKDSSLYQGCSSARIVIELIAQEIIAFPRDITCHEAIARLSRTIKQYYIEHRIVVEAAAHPFKRMGASLILYSKMRKEVWMVGDCHCLIDGMHISNAKWIDHFIADLRSKLIEEYLKNYSIEEMLANDRSRADIYPFLIKQFEFQNNNADSPLSYAVLDGFPIHEQKIVKLDVSGTKEIVMASDGYPGLFNQLGVSETYLAEVLTKDPLCYQAFKSTKGLKKGNVSFDDRSYLKIEIT